MAPSLFPSDMDPPAHDYPRRPLRRLSFSLSLSFSALAFLELHNPARDLVHLPFGSHLRILGQLVPQSPVPRQLVVEAGVGVGSLGGGGGVGLVAGPRPAGRGLGAVVLPPPLAGNASPPREAVPQETVVKEVDVVGLDLAFDFDLNLSMWVGRSALCGSPPSACQHLPWDVGEAGHRGMGTRRGCGKAPRRMRRDGAASEWEDMVGGRSGFYRRWKRGKGLGVRGGGRLV